LAANLKFIFGKSAARRLFLPPCHDRTSSLQKIVPPY
jgi:hypothetical protein